MASSKVMKSYSSSHKQLLNFLIKNHVIGSVMPFIVLCPDITYENFIHIYDTFYQELIEFYDQWIICEKVWEKNSLVLETMQEQLEGKNKNML